MIVNVGDQFLLVKPFGKPNITTTEGKEVTIQCESNREFERCIFSHNVKDEKCKIGLKNGGSPTKNNCLDFFSYGKRSFIYTTLTTCEIKFNVTKEDSGTWTCEMTPLRKTKLLPNSKGSNEDVFGYTELTIQNQDVIADKTKNEDFDEENVLTDVEVNCIVISVLVIIILVIGISTFAFLRSYYRPNLADA